MTALDRLAGENREHVLRLLEYKTEEVAHRDKLDLRIPADLVRANSTVCNEDGEFYNLYRRVISVPVREISIPN
jgi:hypothetical protein